nr:hypothetical protein [Agromyces sp. Leaf222]
MIDGDAAQFHGREHRHERHLDLGEQHAGVLGQRPQDHGCQAQGVPGELGCSGVGSLFWHQERGVGLRKGLAEVHVDEVGEGALGEVRAEQPAGHERVEHEPVDLEARPGSGLHLTLRVGHDLGRRTRQPSVEGCHGLVAGAPRQAHALGRGRDARTDDHAVEHVEAEAEARRFGRGRTFEPVGQRVARERLRSGSLRCGDAGRLRLGGARARPGDGGGRIDELREAFEQRAELESLEQRSHLVEHDRLRLEGIELDVELDIGHQPVQTAVAHRVLALVAQVLADDALDLVGVLEDAVEIAVQAEPLHGGLLADLRDADQVVAGFADEGRDIGVLLGPDAVALGDRRGVVALELRDALGVRVEQGDVVVHELDRVAVARDEEHPIAVGATARRERREDVVGLEVLLLEGRDAHGLQRLLEQRHLALELDRRLTAGALVLGVLAGAEGGSRHVERDREVRRVLVREQQEQHREEPVDGVRVLPVARGEAVDRQCVERPECQRVAVDHEKGGLVCVWHPPSLQAATDSESPRDDGCRDEASRRGIRRACGWSTSSRPTVR